jgi:hypothetical protein
MDPACDLCGAGIGAAHEREHEHVLDVRVREIHCACTACARLCEAPAGRMRRIPDRWRRAESFEIWGELGLPDIERVVLFLLRARRTSRWSAFVPGPSGAVEVSLDDGAQGAIERLSVAREAVEDVEALLARRDARGSEAYLVPVRACYELAGRVRRAWRLPGGRDQVRREAEGFFARVRARCAS